MKGVCNMVAARRILVVDDEPVVTSSCRRILVTEGDDVRTTESGQEGLRQALSEHFDLVMTDLKMPDLDGMELVRTLRKNRPETAIVIITGYGSVPSAVQAIKLGVSDYIEKPFTPEEIIEAIDRALKTTKRPDTAKIEADLVRRVLKLAGTDQDFGQRLLYEGSRVLSGFPLGPQAKAAIVSGDIIWIEKECGELTPTERDWLERRVQAEIW